MLVPSFTKALEKENALVVYVLNLTLIAQIVNVEIAKIKYYSINGDQNLNWQKKQKHKNQRQMKVKSMIPS